MQLLLRIIVGKVYCEIQCRLIPKHTTKTNKTNKRIVEGIGNDTKENLQKSKDLYR